MTSSIDQVIQSFYRAPDVASALVAFDECAAEKQVVPAFSLMAQVNAEFRAGIEARRARVPEFVDEVLRGFPAVSADDPEALDLWWTEFFITGELEPVRRIVAVLDEPDVVRERLTTWLRDIGIGPEGGTEFMKYLPLFQRIAFPIVFSESRVDGPVDLDITVAVSARNGQLKFDELPFTLSERELVRIAAKGAAIWSLRMLARGHELVAKVCAEEATKPGGAARPLLIR